MGYVRPVTEDDIPYIAALHEKVFGAHRLATATTLRAYFAEIFCHNPWCNEVLPSLLYQEKGRILGCIGIMRRPMIFNGRPVQAAVSHNFMVEPEARYTLAGMQLAKVLLSGPQDLCLAEGNPLSRKILEGLGGSTSLLYSIYWTRPLRLSQYVVSLLSKRGLPAPFARALKPICHVADGIISRLRQPFRPAVPVVQGDELSSEVLLSCLAMFSRGRSLRPEYDDHALKWLLETLAKKEGRGTFRKIVVRSSGGDVIGWYLYYLNPGGVSEVVQVAGQRSFMREVLDHLFYDAWQGGAVAVSGYLEPTFFEAFSEANCVFHHGGSSMLVHSRDPAITQAIHRGDAFLTRLEGEWWIGF